ncbi:hypothetical protein V1511DRAFT_521988 [Dipodascopsis uninucleata]
MFLTDMRLLLIKSLGNEPTNQNVQYSNIQTALQAHKVTFFFRLERELEKVNAFYLQKEAELKLRLSTLLEKKKAAKAKVGTIVKTSATFIALHEGFYRFRRDLDKLEQFIELNATGFSKVLKKWDKRSKSQTKELYLSTAVEVQPVFHREDIAELSDLATTSLLELDAWADGEDVSFDHKLSDVSQIERTNEELDTEFLRNVLHESDTAIKEWVNRLRKSVDASERITKIFFQSICGDATNETLKVLYETDLVHWMYKDDVNNRTILHEAAIAGRELVLRYIVDRPNVLSVMINAADIYGRTPLHYASIHGHSFIVNLLLMHGASIDDLDQDNFSSLLFAISQNHASCVENLISYGARIDPASEQDFIPLNMACQKGLYEVTELLLKSKASILPDAEGLYPQHLVAQAGHFRLIPLLKMYGADINMIDKLNGWSALIYAAGEGHKKTVKALLDAGADLSFVDGKNLTPLYYAAWEGHLDCMKLLLEAMTASQKMHSPLNSSGSAQTRFDQNMHEPMDYATYSDPLDADTIPDLSLPPPILPLRRYGHNFLDNKTFIEISFDVRAPDSTASLFTTPFHTASLSTNSALASKKSIPIAETHPSASNSTHQSIRFFSDSNIPAAKLTLSSKLIDVIPRSVLLPLAEDSKTFSFQVDRIEDFVIDFEIYPTFGSRMIAKAVALSHIFQVNSGYGQCTLPLFDLRLQVIGDLTFKFNVIRPFKGKPLEITDYDVYWKSTSQVEPGSAGQGIGTVVASEIMERGHNESGLNVHHMAHAQVHSFVTASSLSGSYSRIYVQITKDLVPVVYLQWTVSLNGVEVPVCNLSADQFNNVGGLCRNLDERRESIARASSTIEAFEMLLSSFLTLEEALRLLPSDINVDLCIIYPTEAEKEYINVVSTVGDLNTSVDAILNVVFEHARAQRSRYDALGESRNRSIVFSSYHPGVCTVLNWKQPNYPVFFCVSATVMSEDNGIRSAHGLQIEKEEDHRCSSLREASTFASSNNFMGIICSSHLLNTVPALIETIRALGLVLVAQKKPHDVNNTAAGIDGVRDDKVLEFNETIDM